MNENSCRTQPLGIEWEFAVGQPCLVAQVPSAEGDTVFRLDDVADLGELTMREREFARSLIRLATRRLDESEPCNTIGRSAS